MRPPCEDCRQTVGHTGGCPQATPPSRRISTGNPLLIDALIQTGHKQTWTA